MTRPSGPCPARLMIVGDAPNEQDILKNSPFSGGAGYELDRMLSEAKIIRSGCFVTNVCRIRAPGNKVDQFIAQKKKDITPQHLTFRDKMVLPPIRDGIELLKREIELCQPNAILACGNVAMWALTGKWGIEKWRGSELQCDLPLALDYHPKVIPTIHPSSIVQWAWNKRPVVVHDMRKFRREGETRELYNFAYHFIIRPDFGQVVATLRRLSEQCSRQPDFKLSVDIETRSGHIACVGLAWSKTEAICIPLMCIENNEGYWNLEEETAIWWQLFKLLTHKNMRVVGQNFIYDAQYFYRHALFTPRLARDTMLAQHVCFSNMEKGLGYLSSMYRDHHKYWKDEGKTWDKSTGEEQLWNYNCVDAVATYEVDTEIQPVVDAMGLRTVHDFQQSLFWPVLESMNFGCRIDIANRGKYAMDLMQEMAVREQWIYDVLGHTINPRSSDQMQALFYTDLKQKVILDRKTKNPTCNEEALTKIAEREPLLRPLVRKITEYRSLGVFLSTFVNAPLDIDNRMRCSFNIAGTVTYRFSSSENAFGTGTNLQNLPKGGADDEELDSLELPNIRGLFIPDPGMVAFDIDLDSADLRIVQREARIAEMGAMLREGRKVYVEVGREFYRDPSFNKDHRHYRTFKAFAHATHYLGTSDGIAGRIGLPVHEVDKLQKWYFGKFPELPLWHKEFKNQVLSRRYVTNVFGYRINVLDRIEDSTFRELIAWLPQGTVACIINRGYRKLYDERKEIQCQLQVHDSLFGQYPAHLGDWAKREIVRCCSIELPYAEPMVIPVGIKTSDVSWGECG